MKFSGYLLKHHIDLQYMTYADLAARVGVTKNTVARWASGRMEPSKENIVKTAQALHVKPDELMEDGTTGRLIACLKATHERLDDVFAQVDTPETALKDNHEMSSVLLGIEEAACGVGISCETIEQAETKHEMLVRAARVVDEIGNSCSAIAEKANALIDAVQGNEEATECLNEVRRDAKEIADGFLWLKGLEGINEEAERPVSTEEPIAKYHGPGWYIIITLEERDEHGASSLVDRFGPFDTMAEAKANEKKAIRQRAYYWDEITRQYECGWDNVTSEIMYAGKTGSQGTD